MSLIEKFKKADAGATVKNFDNSNEPKIKIIDNQFYKIIETEKSSIGKSGIVFLEPMAMEYSKRMGVPAPTVVGVDRDDALALFATEKVHGQEGLDFIEQNPELKEQVELKIEELKNRYLDIGIKRQFDLKDMMIEYKDGDLIITPLDFERVKYTPALNLTKIVEICNDWKIEVPKRVQDKLNVIEEYSNTIEERF